MTEAEVEIGRHYAVKVSGKMTIVMVEAGSPRGGWTGRNIFTNSRIKVQTVVADSTVGFGSA